MGPPIVLVAVVSIQEGQFDVGLRRHQAEKVSWEKEFVSLSLRVAFTGCKVNVCRCFRRFLGWKRSSLVWRTSHAYDSWRSSKAVITASTFDLPSTSTRRCSLPALTKSLWVGICDFWRLCVISVMTFWPDNDLWPHYDLLTSLWPFDLTLTFWPLAGRRLQPRHHLVLYMEEEGPGQRVVQRVLEREGQIETAEG